MREKLLITEVEVTSTKAVRDLKLTFTIAIHDTVPVDAWYEGRGRVRYLPYSAITDTIAERYGLAVRAEKLHYTDGALSSISVILKKKGRALLKKNSLDAVEITYEKNPRHILVSIQPVRYKGCDHLPRELFDDIQRGNEGTFIRLLAAKLAEYQYPVTRVETHS